MGLLDWLLPPRPPRPPRRSVKLCGRNSDGVPMECPPVGMDEPKCRHPCSYCDGTGCADEYWPEEDAPRTGDSYVTIKAPELAPGHSYEFVEHDWPPPEFELKAVTGRPIWRNGTLVGMTTPPQTATPAAIEPMDEHTARAFAGAGFVLRAASQVDATCAGLDVGDACPRCADGILDGAWECLDVYRCTHCGWACKDR